MLNAIFGGVRAGRSWQRAATAAVGAFIFLACRGGGAQESLLVGSRSEQLAYQNIRAALRQRISLDYQEKPLTEMVAELRKSLAINIYFDSTVLTDAGKDPDTLLVSVQVQSVTCEAILASILSAQGLTWYISKESLKITTKEDAETQLQVRVYLVRD